MRSWTSHSTLFFASALELVVILSRHGIRSPIQSNEMLAPLAAQPWPHWPVKPGFLTERGGRLMADFGEYYRERYVKEGLLSGNAAQDAPFITVRSDSDQRTVESARRLAQGLAPGQTLTVVRKSADSPDPLFSPVKLNYGNPDPALARAALLGRMGNDPQAVVEAHRPALERLQRVLFGSDPIAPGKTPPLSLSTTITPGDQSVANLLTIKGPLLAGLLLTDAFILEYAQGMPRSEVGWGRLSREDLTDLMSLHALYFDLTQRTLYLAQAQGSNLAQHLLDTFDQAASGKAVAGAVGKPGQKVLILLGHDTNLINLGGLLDLSWIVPESQGEPVLPGGAMVFELRRGDDGSQRVRIYYATETLDQLRAGAPITLDHPPAVAPIFIPGCSGAEPGYDAPLDVFEARLKSAINPRFVLPSAD